MTNQKQIILNMLLDKPFVCVTEMMAAYIPDYRRRLVDLKQDGYILEGRPCRQHEHKSKNLKEWHLVSKPKERIKEEKEYAEFTVKNLINTYHPELKEVFQTSLF